MGTCRGKGCHTGEREESPLFYTPPPDEKPISFTGALENDSDDAEGTGFPDATAHDRTLHCTQAHAQVAQSCTSYIPDSIVPNPLGCEVLNPELKSSPLRRQTSRSEQGCSGNMSLIGRPLTLFDHPSNGAAKYRNHPSGNKPHESFCRDLISPRAVSPSISTIKLRPIQGTQSLGKLAGYASSEEDELETSLVQGAKKGRPRKTIVYKSSEFVASDSSESEIIHCPLHQTHSSRTILARGKRSQTPATNTVSHLASRSELDDQARKAKDMAAKKRINTKGGFVMDSESDDEASGQSDHDDNDDQSRSFTRQTSYALEPPHSIHNNFKGNSSAKPLPTKQLNMSRLKKLLERGKGVSNAPKQRQLVVQTQPPITTTPALSTWNSHLATSLGLQQSAPSQSVGSGSVDRAKYPVTINTTSEVKVLSQQAKVVGSSMTKIDGKVSSISRKIPPPTAAVTNPGRTPIRSSSASTLPTTIAAGLSSSLLSRKRKPVPDLDIARERKDGMSDNKTSSATQPRSLLQLTLDEVKIGTAGSKPGAQLQASGQNEQNVAKRTPVSSTSAGKSVSIPQPCAKKHENTAVNAGFKKDSSTALQSPKVSKDLASQRAQSHMRVPDPGSARLTPATSRTNASSSPLTPSTPGPSAQKRKLDSISGGSDHVSTTTRKRPASAIEPLMKRPKNTQIGSKVDTSPRSSTASKAVVRKTSTETTNLSGFATAAGSTGLSTSSTRVSNKQGPDNMLPSPTASTLVGHPGSRVPTSSNACATPVVSHLPAHAKETAINNTVENPRIAKKELFPQSKPVDGPKDMGIASTKPNLLQPAESVRHASVAPDAAISAQHNTSSSNRVAESSSEINTSSEGLAANRFRDTIQAMSPKKDTHHIAVTPYPEKALSLSVNIHSGDLGQVAGPGLGIQEQFRSTSASSPAKVPPALTAEPMPSATGKKPLSNSPTTVSEPTPSKESRMTDVAELAALEAEFSESTQTTENAIMHTAEGPTDVIEIDVDRVDPTATIVRRDDMSADTMSVPRAANDRGPSCQAEKAMKTRDSFSLTSLKPASQKHTLIDAHESPSKPSAPPPVQGLSSVEVITDSNQDVLLLSCSPHVSKEAQPYFEYSVFQRVWSSEQTEENIAATETTVRPFTNIVEANEQAEKTFQSILAHFLDAISESSTTHDEHGCSILTGSVTPFDNPFKKTHLRIWVRRDTVSKFANQKPQALNGTSFISSTCYILRLFNLAEQADEESPDASDLEDGDSPAHELVRVYQTHSRPEVYTSLDAANRAARALQIELSHEKEPKDEFSRTFQQNNLQELDRKLRELQSREVDGENGGCWKSKFNACGLGADTLEVVVEKTGICGARNI